MQIIDYIQYYMNLTPLVLEHWCVYKLSHRIDQHIVAKSPLGTSLST